jgi:hypothetical protein
MYFCFNIVSTRNTVLIQVSRIYLLFNLHVSAFSAIIMDIIQYSSPFSDNTSDMLQLR